MKTSDKDVLLCHKCKGELIVVEVGTNLADCEVYLICECKSCGEMKEIVLNLTEFVNTYNLLCKGGYREN